IMLLDINLIIFAANPAYPHLKTLVAGQASRVATITYIEVLGFHKFAPGEKSKLEQIFSLLPLLPLTRDIVDLTVQLRQQRKMSLGDAIIAGTAVVHQLTLATHNVKDFSWINGLTVVDPLIP
ncbi:MAG: type II toxin-antitoxin system VapC family toxin, partial [Planctomycetales bacterium]|nr:type II toxin-antitoxin system VapC family toxin [Planctomycetales bacterium]